MPASSLTPSRSVLRSLVLAALVGGCGASEPVASTDASLPEGFFTFSMERPQLDERFEVFLDDVLWDASTEKRAFLFHEEDDRERTMEMSIVFRASGAVVDQLTVRSNCLYERAFWGPLLAEELSFYAGINGEVRSGGSTCRARSGGGGHSETGEPGCTSVFDSCPEGRCGFRKVSAEPELLQYACTEDGSLSEGQAACTFGAAGLDAFDDCTIGAGCIDGVCKELCYAQYPITTCDDGSPCVRLDGFENSRMGYCER